jgi:hypothetical protein
LLGSNFCITLRLASKTSIKQLKRLKDTMNILVKALVLATALLAPTTSFAAQNPQGVGEENALDQLEHIAQHGTAEEMQALLSAGHNFTKAEISGALLVACLRPDDEGLPLINVFYQNNLLANAEIYIACSDTLYEALCEAGVTVTRL